MKIRTKLNASIWASCIATAVTAIYISLELSSVVSVVRENILINDVTKQIVTLHFLTYDYIQRPLDRKEAQWHASHDALKQSLQRIQSISTTVSPIPPRVVAAYQNIRDTFDQLAALTKSSSHAVSEKAGLAQDIQSHISFLLITKNQELYDWIIRASWVSNERLLATMRRETVVLLALLVGLATSFCALLYFASRSLFRSLNSLHLGVEAISRNDLDYRIPVVVQDELGELSATFNQMTGDLKKLYGSLRESEGRYRAFFEQGPDGVVVLDPETGRFVEFNDQVCRQLGYTRDEFALLRASDVEAAETPEETRAHIQQVVRDGRDDFETVQRTKLGEPRDVHVTAQLISAAGSPIYHCIWRDVTDRKRAEKEREKLQDQLLQAQKMESVGRLAGGVAHDFNNTLQVILAHSEMALEEVDPASPLHENLLEMQRAAERSADLTRQLLAFARKQTASPKVLDLNETVGGMLKMLRLLIGEGIALAWKPCPDLGLVRVDPSQVDQVLANLCVNSRDAIRGVGKVVIETGNAAFDEAQCAGGTGLIPGVYVMLAVSDDGCGMDSEVLEHIFEPFFTTKGLGEGTGLGLSTVYGIVKQNGGFINVYSETDRGTTFRIYLPRFEGRSGDARKERAVEPVDRGWETVLLVEDEPAILDMGASMLKRLGYHVLPVRTPGAAIGVAEAYEGEIHLLVTDVIMPEMNGRDLADLLKSHRPGLRRLFMSGYTADVIASHGVLEEGVHFIAKPFGLKALATKLREAIDGA